MLESTRGTSISEPFRWIRLTVVTLISYLKICLTFSHKQAAKTPNCTPQDHEIWLWSRLLWKHFLQYYSDFEKLWSHTFCFTVHTNGKVLNFHPIMTIKIRSWPSKVDSQDIVVRHHQACTLFPNSSLGSLYD